jgi:hypothetical protein
MLLRYVLPLWLVAACGHADPIDHSEPVSSELRGRDIAQRALDMSDDGWIVSRNADGSAADRGDSLLFTGLAMGAMDCDQGAAPEHALLNMLAVNHGLPQRHRDLPAGDYSLDGLLGLWWGISARVAACPEAASPWIQLLEEHEKAVAIEPGFVHVLHTVMAQLGMRPGPSEKERGHVGALVSAWAMATVSQQAAAYRLHLGFLALSVVDAPKGRDLYCAAVQDAHMPLIEDFCGRDGLREWLETFRYDEWVYRHQRAVWEGAPDGNGKKTPAIDWLVGATRFGQ